MRASVPRHMKPTLILFDFSGTLAYLSKFTLINKIKEAPIKKPFNLEFRISDFEFPASGGQGPVV